MGASRQRLLLVGLPVVALVAALWAGACEDGAEPVGPAPTASASTARRSGASSSSSTTSSTIDPAAIAATDRFVTASGGSPVVGRGTLHTYVVEVEEGIPVDPHELAAAVDATLADPRGWTAPGDISLQRVGPGETPSFRVRLATPATVDAHCAPLETNGIYSCRQGADVMINLVRWLEGATASQLGLDDYRHYVISHEVGHALGHGHVGCPAPGAVAPVMMQQTKGIGGYSPNPWPYP